MAPWSGWLPRPCLVQNCWLLVNDLGHKAAGEEPQGALSLTGSLVVGLGSGGSQGWCLSTRSWCLYKPHWQAEPSPGVWLQGQEVPELVSNHWWVGPVLDTFGCKVWGSQNLCWSAGGWVGPTGYRDVLVLGLMFTHWCVRLGFSQSQGLLVSGLVGCGWLQLFWGCRLPTGEWGWFRAKLISFSFWIISIDPSFRLLYSFFCLIKSAAGIVYQIILFITLFSSSNISVWFFCFVFSFFNFVCISVLFSDIIKLSVFSCSNVWHLLI